MPSPTNPPVHGQCGAGSVLAVAILGAVLCLLSLVIPLYIVLDAKQRAADAADASALAAADSAVGIVAGNPCAVAGVVAYANGAQMAGCRVDGLVVTVRVEIARRGFSVSAVATAGPPVSAILRPS
ncbi:MAG: hypothetical protein JWP30_124 [Homoserinimonas sp.]|jgi:secretion/DNA translocation related TadE-like protein|nr:hypothetical protein [Homoserinimonas sp.]